MAPQLIFGTAGFGMDGSEVQDAASAGKMLSALQDLGINRLDSGARYPPLNPGRAEQLIGEGIETLVVDGKSCDFEIDTKVYTDVQTDGSGDLTPARIRTSAEGSLERLKRPSTGVNVLHIHRADPATPLEDQIRGFTEQIEAGHCKSWGASNVSIPVLKEMLRLCEDNHWPKPVCYQGQYNLITRGAEAELLPLLRAHGIAFNGYGPIAAGFLTGKLINNEHQGTRLGNDSPLGSRLQKLFESESLHGAMRKFDQEVKAQGLTPIEVAIRWAAHHSALGEQDSIVLGGGKIAQVVENVGLLRKGPLPDGLLSAVDMLWEAAKESRGDVL